MTYITSNGYRKLTGMAGHPLADSNGEVFEHRLVASQALGRGLRPGEHVHHINEDKLDNRAENLEVVDATEHARLHHQPTNLTDAEVCELVLLGRGFDDFKRFGVYEHRVRRIRAELGVVDRTLPRTWRGRMLDIWAQLTGRPEYRECKRGHRQTAKTRTVRPNGSGYCRICANAQRFTSPPSKYQEAA